MCKYSYMHTSPWGWRPGGEIAESPPSLVIHAHKPAPSWQNTQSKYCCHTQRHTHTCLRQFISMQISVHPSSGRSSWQTAFSLLYHMEDLDCIVSSRAEPNSYNMSTYSASPAWTDLLSFMLSRKDFFILHFVHGERCSHAHAVKDVYLQCLKCAV